MQAAVGVKEHGNSAILVTVSSDGRLLDRRRVNLTHGLPTHPYHHEGSWAVGRYIDSPWAKPTTVSDAMALVERVHVAAAEGARESLDALSAAFPETITAIAIRVCADLPPTIEARIRDARAATMADSIMYRRALAEAATARGWRIDWYNRDTVFDEASEVVDDLAAHLAAMGKAAGAPWQASHKLAAAAAIVASTR